MISADYSMPFPSHHCVGSRARPDRPGDLPGTRRWPSPPVLSGLTKARARVRIGPPRPRPRYPAAPALYPLPVLRAGGCLRLPPDPASRQRPCPCPAVRITTARRGL